MLLVLIKGGDRLFSELQSKVFYKMALAADESMMLYTMEKTTRFKQIFFDSSASYDKLKDVIRDDFSVWSLNGCLNEILTSFITIVGVCVILMPYNALLTCLAMVAAVPLFALNLAGERYDEKSEGILNRGKTRRELLHGPPEQLNCGKGDKAFRHIGKDTRKMDELQAQESKAREQCEPQKERDISPHRSDRGYIFRRDNVHLRIEYGSRRDWYRRVLHLHG